MWGPIILALIPKLPAIIAAFIRKEYPQLNDAQVKAITVEITGVSDSGFDEAIATFTGGQKEIPPAA